MPTRSPLNASASRGLRARNAPRGEQHPLAPHERVTRAAAAAGRVLIDRHGRYGGAPAAHFKTLLRALQRGLAAGDTTVVLSGAKLNVVVLALQKAIWVEEEVLPRDLHAFSALNDRTHTPDQRLRVVAERLLARPDRHREGRSASYPVRRIVAEYRALTGQGDGDTSSYVSRKRSGLARRSQRFEPLALPLSRSDAVQAIRSFHAFPSRRAAAAFIRAAILALPASQRPRLPAARG